MQQLLKFLKIDADKLESLVRDMSRESRLWTKVLEAWSEKLGKVPHRFRPKFEVIIAVPKNRYRFFIMDSINHKLIVIMIDFCCDVPVVSHKSVIPC